MNVLLAESLGMCFGVRDALGALARIERPETVTIHGELVHNDAVLVQLQARGFGMLSETDRDVPETEMVLITAHGVSDKERKRLQSAGKQLIDTTCPLVRRVHEAAQKLQAEGFHVLVVGKRDHVEVRGIVGDLERFAVIESVEEVREYAWKKLGVICQTTTPTRLVGRILQRIHIENPGSEVRFIDTVCHPTKDRQRALERLLPLVDVMVVVGGKSSNNTRELASRCRESGVAVHHVGNAADIDPSWFTGSKTVGLTAGTSTLASTVDEVAGVLRNLGAENGSAGVSHEPVPCSLQSL